MRFERRGVHWRSCTEQDLPAGGARRLDTGSLAAAMCATLSLVLLTGCSGGGEREKAAASEPQVQATEPAPTRSAGGPATPDSAQGDPDGSSLTVTAWGVPIPDAPIDRSNEAELTRQWWTAKAQCLSDNGFPAFYDGEGITITGGGVDQKAARQAASTACEEETTAQLGPLPAAIPYSVEELRAQHALLVDSASCLEEAGYPPASAPPSVDSFVANEHLFYAGHEQAEANRWSPYPEDPNAYLQAVKTCPYPMGPQITAWLAENS